MSATPFPHRPAVASQTAVLPHGRPPNPAPILVFPDSLCCARPRRWPLQPMPRTRPAPVPRPFPTTPTPTAVPSPVLRHGP
ncbi:hypothetical protein FA95DRAFT_1560560 [Auriscalpium vulgare]|uniref:Uncharacterized protein n=1 Tax=Auriscalpium vulgare TaxID=40419 RepID=A0ACB8RP60_9AGAM|nr:hypothetical protein FA95DRAFT_1560560 [Auriscalpium vulgare]